MASIVKISAMRDGEPAIERVQLLGGNVETGRQVTPVEQRWWRKDAAVRRRRPSYGFRGVTYTLSKGSGGCGQQASQRRVILTRASGVLYDTRIQQHYLETDMIVDPAYFLYHSIGQYPGKSADMAAALERFSKTWGALDDRQWSEVLRQRHAFLDLWRVLIDAPEGTLTSAENVTSALFSILGGLPAQCLRGKRVLVAADCFPSLHFLLNGMAGRLGYTLETVPVRQGDFWVRDEDMIAAWGEDVGLALLTFVTSTSSHRCDLAGLIAHGQQMGSLVGVDLTQGIGIIPFSLDDYPADFVVSTTLKWLCGTPGAGIIQMRADLIDAVRPELRGWFSQPNPFSWDLDAFEYAPDARRFEHGTPSVLACIGSVPALRWHAGQDGLLAHNRALTGLVIAQAGQAGLTLATPLAEHRRGGSVMLHLPGECDPDTVIDGLRQRNVYVDARGRILRVSPGVVTTAAHVARLFEGLVTLL